MTTRTKTKPAAGPSPVASNAGGLPVVVLVGRANVGKSTIFNRIAGRGRAIVSAIAGTTRDVNLARATHDDREFVIADSGGLELYAREPATERAVEEALAAVAAADLVVLVIDGRAGITTGDREALALIRETGRPVIAAVNKVDHANQEASAAEAYALGLASVTFISAAHGLGMGDLLDAIVAQMAPREAVAEHRPDLRVALIGRPNVGKSSILNRLAGYDRAIVDDRPGTTRDPVDVRLDAGGRDVLLIDTAGIRRPPKVEGDLEHHSVGRAIEVIRRAEVLVLVIDATEGITDQDVRLARLVESNDRAMVVVCNKWDAAAKAGKRVPIFVRDAYHRHPFLEFAAMIFTSAVTGDGVDDILPAAARAGDGWHSAFQTAQLNRILAETINAQDPPLVGRRRLKMMYVTQTGSAPPRLVFFTNVERDIPAHYIRFLEGRFRTALQLDGVGTPLRLEFRRTGRSWVESRPPPAADAPRVRAARAKLRRPGDSRH
ncbi:MAG TPA: ribosome biogenesis GTPase Der [Candidatus Binataceae bacterium]|nr:ribosome biogenesis GTPase Der [Candidatus Binataceae bacterium]